MSLIYEFKYFEEKLKNCESVSDVRILYEILKDQIDRVKKNLEEEQEKLEAKLAEVQKINLHAYSDAVNKRLDEFR